MRRRSSTRPGDKDNRGAESEDATLCAKTADLPAIRRRAEKIRHDPVHDVKGRSTADIAAQHALGLDNRASDQLFLAAGNFHTDETRPVTPHEAALAGERLPAGTDAEEIRDHLCPEAADGTHTDQDEADAA